MHFLQSKDWQTFQSGTGSIPRTIQIGKETIVGYEKTYPFFRYLYIGGIPYSEKTEKILLTEVKTYADAVQIDWLDTGKGGKTTQASWTMQLDVRKSDQELLEQMHHKTRYNIRVAQRHNIHIEQCKDAEVFYSLMKKTSSRQSFQSHPKAYYERMLDIPGCELFVAKKEGTVIGAIILLTNKEEKITYYLHGASDDAYKKYMAPYLLQWYAIQFAKEHGADCYDFWGVAPPAKDGESFYNYSWERESDWSGFTRFKAGFGGTPVQVFRGELFVIHNIRYMLYTILATIKRKIFKNL